MIEKYTLFMVYKNFFRTQFIKRHQSDPDTNRQTPAMSIGITEKVFEFHEFFDVKKTLKQVPLNREWECFHIGKSTYPRMAVLKKAA
jgi:hypothetical protein